jgi:DNA mismatch repair protein MutL
MSRIRVLPDILASQVAAGEVVERPSSVVKELVENSLDSGASEVRVEITRGGVASIRVADDGSGMAREDALLCLERHATSKLRVAGDLNAIMTLGFRGEAIPSIASVSRFRLVTREREAVVGTEIEVVGGKLADVRDAGCAPGTMIEVRDLFFNIPARRKFLKAESTESAHVEHQLRLHALAFPDVSFRFRSGDRVVFEWPAVRRRIDRVRQLIDRETAKELIALPGTGTGSVSVEGFVLPARHARRGRKHQFVFLNGRPIEDAVVSRALLEAFRGSMPEGMHPGAWLWIRMEPSHVDVNVHPAKREVRFHRPLDLREVIMKAVNAGVFASDTPPARVAPPPQISSPVAPARTWPAVQPLQTDLPMSASRAEPGGTAAPQVELPVASASPRFRPLGILHDRFHVLESEGGLVLLDPRAARERIRYEKLLSVQHEVAVQVLLVPVLLDVDPREADVLARNLESFAAAGVEVEPFGGNTVQIRSLPACLPGVDPLALMHAVLDDLASDRQTGARFTRERVARMLARRASFGETARPGDLPGLLDELFACELPYCAPDGRPTLSEFSLRELDRRFGTESGRAADQI